MNPNNVVSILLNNQFEHELIQLATSLAETGQSVWFISPTSFDHIPISLKPLEKEILQLISFMYLKTWKDLLTHLNSIHLWKNIPNAIIITGFEVYANLQTANFNSLQSAFLATILLDSASVCAKKMKRKTLLLVACDKTEELHKLQLIHDLYFLNFIVIKEQDSSCVDSILDLLR